MDAKMLRRTLGASIAIWNRIFIFNIIQQCVLVSDMLNISCHKRLQKRDTKECRYKSRLPKICINLIMSGMSSWYSKTGSTGALMNENSIKLFISTFHKRYHIRFSSFNYWTTYVFINEQSMLICVLNYKNLETKEDACGCGISYDTRGVLRVSRYHEKEIMT